jgi:hypothetical protein
MTQASEIPRARSKRTGLLHRFLNFRLSDDERETLDSIAQANSLSTADIARFFIREGIQRYQHSHRKRVRQPIDGAQTVALTDARRARSARATERPRIRSKRSNGHKTAGAVVVRVNREQ